MIVVVLSLLALVCGVASWRLIAFWSGRRQRLIEGHESHVGDWTLLAFIASLELGGAAILLFVAGFASAAWDGSPSGHDLLGGAFLLLGSIAFTLIGIAYVIRGGRRNPFAPRGVSAESHPVWPHPRGLYGWTRDTNITVGFPAYGAAIFAIASGGAGQFVSVTVLF